MENNNITQIITDNSVKRICKQCGQELPLTAFDKYRGKYRTICRKCLNANKSSNPKFENVTSRELIEELRFRGYRGELSLVRIDKVVI